MRVGRSAPATARPADATADRFEGKTRTFKTVLAGRAAPGHGTAPPQPPPPAPIPASTVVRGVLERAVAAERNVDTLLAAAARGKTFSPAELLALQATVFRYSQTVEIVSRVADRLVGAVKQVMGTQV
jgi:hypothetical protein